jgi:hypothetical protein
MATAALAVSLVVPGSLALTADGADRAGTRRALLIFSFLNVLRVGRVERRLRGVSAENGD